MPDPAASDPALLDELRAVHGFYRALAPRLVPGHALGGTLIFAGVLDPQATQLIRAANIAGAASLTVSSAPAELRAALRAGVVDFLVTSLDEALRILKNEIRKRLPVAVAVEGTPLELGNEMMARGVQPDLLPPTALAIEPACARAAFLERGAALVEPEPDDPAEPLRIWPVPAAWNARTQDLEVKLAELLPAAAHARRRWLRLAPRYLGAQARRLRSVAANEALDAAVSALLHSQAG